MTNDDDVCGVDEDGDFDGSAVLFAFPRIGEYFIQHSICKYDSGSAGMNGYFPVN